MITARDLRKIGQGRLKDAEALFRARRYDGAVYLAGYAVEVALKARFCRTLKWPGFPQTNREFEGLLSFKTHNLDILLRLSGAETGVKASHFADWSIVATWDPEVRYKPVGSAMRTDAREMLNAAKAVVRAL